MNDVPKFIKRSLAGRLLFAFDAQLADEEISKIYDAKFLERIGEKREKMNRIGNIYSYFLIVSDILLVIISNNIKFNISIYGNKISNSDGLLELTIILSSFFLFKTAMYLYSSLYYDKIIERVINSKIEIFEPIFMKSSYITELFIFSVMHVFKNGYKNNIKSLINILLIAIIGLTIVLLLSIFHFWAFYIGIETILGENSLGPFLSSLAVWIGCAFNLLTIFYVTSTLCIRFKYNFQESEH